MAISKELEKTIRSAAQWSIGTWHHNEFRELKILSVTQLVGPLYHVTFSVITHVPITVNALFLDLPISLILNRPSSSTLTPLLGLQSIV